MFCFPIKRQENPNLLSYFTGTGSLPYFCTYGVLISHWKRVGAIPHHTNYLNGSLAEQSSHFFLLHNELQPFKLCLIRFEPSCSIPSYGVILSHSL